MVQAYTLRDRIVQQGFNDFHFLVGKVYKSVDAGVSFTAQTAEELQASGAVPNVVEQVVSFDNSEGFYPGVGDKNTHDYVKFLLDLDPGNGLGLVMANVFQYWDSVGTVQWVQIRRVEVVGVANTGNVVVKLVVDAFVETL
jgi:hypothetical protein